MALLILALVLYEFLGTWQIGFDFWLSLCAVLPQQHCVLQWFGTCLLVNTFISLIAMTIAAMTLSCKLSVRLRCPLGYCTSILH